jgi:NAD(P)-dependent dehydrogenase (short-subunit alcohol dehydrogenase family)
MALNPFSLEGRTAIVTGAGRGIGAAIASALDGAGARVALVSRTATELDAVAATLTHDPVVIAADLGPPDGPDTVAARALDAFGGHLDVLVNNAGAVLRKDTEALTAVELDELWAVNVRSVLLLCRAVLAPWSTAVAARSSTCRRSPPCEARPDGRLRRHQGGARHDPIAGHGVRPPLRAGQLDRARRHRDRHVEHPAGPARCARRARGHRPATVGVADDIAPVVLFLASNLSRYMTGETTVVDGGMHATMNLYPTV